MLDGKEGGRTLRQLLRLIMEDGLGEKYYFCDFDVASEGATILLVGVSG